MGRVAKFSVLSGFRLFPSIGSYKTGCISGTIFGTSIILATFGTSKSFLAYSSTIFTTS